jgi:hypothetical protein
VLVLAGYKEAWLGRQDSNLPHGSQKPKQKQSLASIVAQANVASLWSSFQARIYDLAVAN